MISQRFAPTSPIGSAGRWQDRAACAGMDRELFFPGPADAVGGNRARAVCRRCPVIRPCLSYALIVDVHGVWGATTKTERDALRADHDIQAVSAGLNEAD